MNKNQKRVAIIAIVLTIILVFAGRAFACDKWTCNHYSEWDDCCMLCSQRDYLMNYDYYELVKFGKEECHFMITPTNEGFRMKSTDNRMDFDFFFDMVHNEACGQIDGELVRPQEWLWWDDGLV